MRGEAFCRAAAGALLLAALAHAARGAEDAALDAGLDDDEQLALDQEESRNVRPRAYPTGAYNALPSGFRPTPTLAELAGYQRAPEAANYPEQAPQPQPQPQRQPQTHRQAQQHRQPLREGQRPQQPAEEEEEREEPDRLAQLLQQSRFDCVGKQTGYYADQELACEVFHYCQDSVKHSWICPDGFTFHQVHLICMPPTQENICQQSAKYHFINEYLYRPTNQEEVDRKPNVSLKYSDRYYPAEVYNDDRYDDDDDENQEERAAPAPRPVARPTAAAARPAPAQVFRSAEEVNIPLLQRRPQRPYEFDF